MGGHGGLNILPQKRWNVYNFDNREKVRKDEEAAAKEEQLKREQAHKRDSEFRIEQLRQARGLGPSNQAAKVAVASAVAEPVGSELDLDLDLDSKPISKHINLFEGIKIFDPVTGAEAKVGGDEGRFKKMKMTTKKESVAPKVVLPEDEPYRLGYGVAGKGVKLPWYLSKPEGRGGDDDNGGGEDDTSSKLGKVGVKSNGKKTIQELREERLKRERREKERERVLILDKRRSEVAAMRDRQNSRRGLGWKENGSLDRCKF